MNFPPLENETELRRHELLADVAEQITKRLMEVHGQPLEIAVDMGNALADFLADHWKGQQLYITADVPYRHSLRDMEIYRRMGRGMAYTLGAEFGISYVRVYQIYRRMLNLMQTRAQPDMFTGLDGGEPAVVTAQEALAAEPHTGAVVHSSKIAV